MQANPEPTSPRANSYFSPLVLSLCLLILLLGCQSQETYAPPVDIRTQPIDAESAGLVVEDAAQYIVTELPSRPGIVDTKYRLVMGLGPIEVRKFNQPERFVTVMRSLNTRLMNNETMNKYFKMVAISVPTSQALTAKLSGGHSDSFETPDSDAATGPQTYDPRDIYILTGEFTQFGDQGNEKRSLQLTINVEHPQSRTIVLSKHIKRNFVWDSASGKWIPVPK